MGEKKSVCGRQSDRPLPILDCKSTEAVSPWKHFTGAITTYKLIIWFLLITEMQLLTATKEIAHLVKVKCKESANYSYGETKKNQYKITAHYSLVIFPFPQLHKHPKLERHLPQSHLKQ